MYWDKWIGYFSGVSQPETHHMGIGAFLLNPAGEVVWQAHQTTGKGTKELANYLALLMVVSEAATHHQARRLTLLGDFGPVIAQVNGEQVLENQSEIEVAKQVWTIMHNFDICSVKRVSLNENRDAIELAKSSFAKVNSEFELQKSAVQALQEVNFAGSLQLNSK
ncbi:hypothetical protein D2Q93_08710 [Alicyclobacillaceae bacterium I2511]|nr:hypothetical protein D2Q93_08710 [Alicyclobacillaceae bacterium I2511]